MSSLYYWVDELLKDNHYCYAVVHNKVTMAVVERNMDVVLDNGNRLHVMFVVLEDLHNDKNSSMVEVLKESKNIK